LEYFDGEDYVELDSETSDAGGYTKISFDAVTTGSIRIRATETVLVDAEKFIGEFISCLLYQELPDFEGSSYHVSSREKAVEQIMGDGSLSRIVTPFGQARTQRYEASFSFEVMARADVDLLVALRETNRPFLFQPESVTRPSEIYLVRFSGPINERYSSSYKGSGYTVSPRVREV
jgi:hypothetical protein